VSGVGAAVVVMSTALVLLLLNDPTRKKLGFAGEFRRGVLKAVLLVGCVVLSCFLAAFVLTSSAEIAGRSAFFLMFLMTAILLSWLYVRATPENVGSIRRRVAAAAVGRLWRA
jgi:multisubunit Na+/H+ antiporter MnhB subunit